MERHQNSEHRRLVLGLLAYLRGDGKNRHEAYVTHDSSYDTHRDGSRPVDNRENCRRIDRPNEHGNVKQLLYRHTAKKLGKHETAYNLAHAGDAPEQAQELRAKVKHIAHTEKKRGAIAGTEQAQHHEQRHTQKLSIAGELSYRRY